jgi:ribosomal protein L29
MRIEQSTWQAENYKHKNERRREIAKIKVDEKAKEG